MLLASTLNKEIIIIIKKREKHSSRSATFSKVASCSRLSHIETQTYFGILCKMPRFMMTKNKQTKIKFIKVCFFSQKGYLL